MQKRIGILFIFLTFLALTGHAQNTNIHFLKPHISGISNEHLVATLFDSPQVQSGMRVTATDTLRILALRVSFQPDTIAETTGNGQFQLTRSDSIYIDPPPHNRTYFQAQLASLAHYYRTVSGGKLILAGDVLPATQDKSYRLPHRMAYYNPNTTEAELDQRLSELLRDALAAADSSESFSASKYDVFMIFHAGVGQDVALDYDTSPQDIPSAFLNFDHLKKSLGENDPGFQGIPFEDTIVKEALILPETEVQSTSIQIGLKGTLALMMGYQLGLPALYDVKSGKSGIGKWGLMDQGSGNYSGLIPAQPCAWSKVFMGWEKPVILKPGTQLRVAASYATSAPHIYKIPINSHEYFLIENRLHDFNGDGYAIGRDQYGNRVELDANGQVKAQDSLGVIVQVDDYDFDIPGSGILIWHIDDTIISRYYHSNAINGNPEHKGVELMEADGSQDIGQSYGFLNPGSGSELGTMYDPFYKGNENHLAANHSQTVEFGPYTAPSSKSFSGANTHILLNQFSKIDTVMSVLYTNDLFSPGFPQAVVPPGTVTFPPVVFDSNGNGHPEIFVATPGGKLFGWKSNGEKIIPNADSLSIETEPMKFTRFPLSLLSDVKDSLVAPPIFLWDDVSQSYFAVLAGKSGNFWRVQLTDSDHNGRADSNLWGTLNTPLTTIMGIGPTAGTQDSTPKLQTILLGTVGGTISSLNFKSGVQTVATRHLQNSPVAGFCRFSRLPLYRTTRVDTFEVLFQNGWLYKMRSPLDVVDSTRVGLEGPFFQPVAGYLTQTGGLVTLILSESGKLTALSHTGEVVSGFPVDIGTRPATRPILMDLRNDGRNEIIVSSASALFAFDFNGVLTEGFPKIYRNGLPIETPNWNQPVGISFNQPQTSLILLGNEAGQLQAFSKSNTRFFDFPLSTGDAIVCVPAIAKIDQNPTLLAVSKDGFLYAWNLHFLNHALKFAWTGIGNSPFQTNLQLETGVTSAETPKALVGNHWAYNYPNPTHDNQTTIRYHLNHPAQVSIKIFDISGNLIDQFTGPGLGPADNEVVWNLNSVGNGVYIVRVKAKSASKSAVTFFKIAVVK